MKIILNHPQDNQKTVAKIINIFMTSFKTFSYSKFFLKKSRGQL